MYQPTKTNSEMWNFDLVFKWDFLILAAWNKSYGNKLYEYLLEVLQNKYLLLFLKEECNLFSNANNIYNMSTVSENSMMTKAIQILI